jgi:hypothetical protein
MSKTGTSTRYSPEVRERAVRRGEENRPGPTATGMFFGRSDRQPEHRHVRPKLIPSLGSSGSPVTGRLFGAAPSLWRVHRVKGGVCIQASPAGPGPDASGSRPAGECLPKGVFQSAPPCEGRSPLLPQVRWSEKGSSSHSGRNRSRPTLESAAGREHTSRPTRCRRSDGAATSARRQGAHHPETCGEKGGGVSDQPDP